MRALVSILLLFAFLYPKPSYAESTVYPATYKCSPDKSGRASYLFKFDLKIMNSGKIFSERTYTSKFDGIRYTRKIEGEITQARLFLKQTHFKSGKVSGYRTDFKRNIRVEEIGEFIKKGIPAIEGRKDRSRRCLLYFSAATAERIINQISQRRIEVSKGSNNDSHATIPILKEKIKKLSEKNKMISDLNGKFENKISKMEKIIQQLNEKNAKLQKELLDKQKNIISENGPKKTNSISKKIPSNSQNRNSNRNSRKYISFSGCHKSVYKYYPEERKLTVEPGESQLYPPYKSKFDNLIIIQVYEFAIWFKKGWAPKDKFRLDLRTGHVSIDTYDRGYVQSWRTCSIIKRFGF